MALVNRNNIDVASLGYRLGHLSRDDMPSDYVRPSAIITFEARRARRPIVGGALILQTILLLLDLDLRLAALIFWVRA
jgi:hypothetical protein